MLINNDWILMNSIIYKIHCLEDIDKMRKDVMQDMKFLIDYDSTSFYMASIEKERELNSPIGINYDEKGMYDYLEIFKNLDYSVGLMYTGMNVAYRESDLLDDKIRVESEYYKKVYDTHNWHYSLHLNISYQETFVGILSFFREKGKSNFEYKDIFVLDMLKEHFAYRLYNELEKRKSRKWTVEKCQEEFRLTEKESDVLIQLLTEYSLSEIADMMNISSNTLRKHITSIYQKTGFKGRVQLINSIEHQT